MHVEIGNSATDRNIKAKFIQLAIITVKITADNRTTGRNKELVQISKKGFAFSWFSGSVNTEEVNLTTRKTN